MDGRLVDHIYEAGAIPDLWADLLEDITRLAGGVGGVLWVPTAGRWMATPGIRDLMAEFEESGLAFDNPRTGRLLARGHPGFVTDQDVFALDEIPREPIYRDFFIPRGGGYGVATVIPAPSGDLAILHVERAFAAGPVDTNAVAALDELRPHLARAALLSARLELQRAAAAAAALEAIGVPGGIIGIGGRLVAVNRLLDELMPEVVMDRRGRVTLADEGPDRLLGDAVGRLDAAAGPGVRSIPLAATDSHPPMIVHLIPVRGAAHDVFVGATGIIIVTPVVPREVPSAEVLQGLFDLTPAEARIARLIGNGETIATAARAVGVAGDTARKQMNAVLSKTGLHRQAELVGLLRGVPVPGVGRG